MDNKYGTHWPFYDLNSWDNEIEQQAFIIKAFQTIQPNDPAIPSMKKWLLSQKETTHWPTAKSTSVAIAALLGGDDPNLLSNTPLQITIGSKIFQTSILNKENGSTPIKIQYQDNQIQKEYASIAIQSLAEKQTDELSYSGNITYRYFQDRNTTIENDLQIPAISLSRSLISAADKGIPFAIVDSSSFQTGDELIVELKLHAARAMDYIHIQDTHAATFENTDASSETIYQSGITVYKTSDDFATHFYIDHIEPGNYVFHYKVKLTHKGWLSTGYAKAECYYAPTIQTHTGTQIIYCR
jgi:hypothetical protein